MGDVVQRSTGPHRLAHRSPSPLAPDVVSAREVAQLRHHSEVVRDLSWHPHLPLIATVSFDGTTCLWDPEGRGDSEALADEDRAAKAQAEASGGGKRGARRTSARLNPTRLGDQLGPYW